MNPELEQLQREVGEAMGDLLSYDSKLAQVFQSRGLMGEGLVKFQCIIDLTKVKSMDTVRSDSDMKATFQALPGQELVLFRCLWIAGCPRCCNF